MKLSALDAATELTQVGETRFSRNVDETWWNYTSAFGGWAAATAFAAIDAHDDKRGELLSLNCIFPSAIKAGRIELDVELLSRRSQSDFWRVAMTHEASPNDTIFAADIVMGQRREIDEPGFQAPAPAKPPADAQPVSDMDGLGPAWLQHYDQILYAGAPFEVNPSPMTRAMISHKDHRIIDTKGLLAIADTPMPRVFFTSTSPRFGSTIALSVTTVCSSDELAGLSLNSALIEANSRSVNDGLYDQDVRIWAPEGRLLAVSNQTAVYR